MNTARSARNNKASSSGMNNRKLTDEQVRCLEYLFEDKQKLEVERKNDIAAHLNLDPQQVAVWFQNKRARGKRENVEEENLQLKEAYCRLEKELSEVIEQLVKELVARVSYELFEVKEQMASVSNELLEAKEQLASVSNELSETKEQLASVSNERDELIMEKLGRIPSPPSEYMGFGF